MSYHHAASGFRVYARRVTGTVLLNGSYVSAREEPGDFDLLLIAQPEIQEMKDADPRLARKVSLNLQNELAGQNEGTAILNRHRPIVRTAEPPVQWRELYGRGRVRSEES